jgi:hypothetical protein
MSKESDAQGQHPGAEQEHGQRCEGKQLASNQGAGADEAQHG